MNLLTGLGQALGQTIAPQTPLAPSAPTVPVPTGQYITWGGIALMAVGIGGLVFSREHDTAFGTTAGAGLLTTLVGIAAGNPPAQPPPQVT